MVHRKGSYKPNIRGLRVHWRDCRRLVRRQPPLRLFQPVETRLRNEGLGVDLMPGQRSIGSSGDNFWWNPEPTATCRWTADCSHLSLDKIDICVQYLTGVIGGWQRCSLTRDPDHRSPIAVHGPVFLSMQAEK